MLAQKGRAQSDKNSCKAALVFKILCRDGFVMGQNIFNLGYHLAV